MSDIFISYAKKDRPKAQQLALALEGEGWTVWWDPHIPAGKTFDKVIEEELDAASCVIVLWSQNSLNSEWVRTEADEGHRRGILVPILMDDVMPPLAFRRVQAADLIGWDGARASVKFQKLVADVAAILGPSPEGPPKEPHEEEIPSFWTNTRLVMTCFTVAVIAVGAFFSVQQKPQPVDPVDPDRGANIDLQQDLAEIKRRAEEERRKAAEEEVRKANEEELLHIEAEQEKERRVNELLAQAEQAIRSARLTIPPNDNALAYYHEVLVLQPDHPAAEEGLLRIMEKYLGWANDKILENRFDLAEDYLNKAALAKPDHTAIQEMHERLAGKREKVY